MKSLFESQEYCTVSQITAQIKNRLERDFADVWVVGEISSLTRASSGHIYLSLKDRDAVLRSVIWRTTALQINFEFDEGTEVWAQGRISVYPPRGEYQFVIERLQPRGVGAAELALLKLKEKLAKLGYFAPERKRPLPRFPRRVALVTSAAGAAIRDMLEILHRRWPVGQIVVCPARVQGYGAAQDISSRLIHLNRVPGIDVVLLGRGGGSNEDLSAFNEEVVARAIFQARAPVISAVGHEIDVTIADMVADKRALTPSEAAELATPDYNELCKTLGRRGLRLRDIMAARLESAYRRLEDIACRRALRQPLERIRERERRLDETHERLGRAVRHNLFIARQTLEKRASQLASLSPLNVLARGYSLTRTLPDLHVVHDARQLRPDERVEIRLCEGRVIARVEETESPTDIPHA